MPLDMEISLGPGDFVFDGNPAPPRRKGTTLTHFLAMSSVAKRLDGCYLYLGPGDVVLDGVAAVPPKRGTAPSFRFMSIVAKRLDG